MMSKAKDFIRLASCAALLCFPAAAATCDSLTSLKLTNTSITSAELVAAGTFVPPGPAPSPATAAMLKSLPAFCRVQGVIAPSSDSHIEFEVWLPATGWNGKYMGAGNGGFAGSISYAGGGNAASLASGLQDGYVSSSTDTGHKGGGTDAQWAMGHPEKIVDYGYRAIHETAEKSKAIIGAFYGEGPQYSYFSSCSNGGREALMEAQRFPADYDGLIAGAPAAADTQIGAKFSLDILATEVDPASYIPKAKLPAIDAATLAACDALDGLKDGVIDDPRKCHFDPATLLCKGDETDACLTQPQVAALKKIYGAAKNSKGEQLYPGFPPGAETGWAAWITGDGPGKSLQYAFATQSSAYMLFNDPSWDFRKFNIDRDSKIAQDTLGERLNATNPDLKSFESRGGKLILYHGWSDPALSPLATIDYFQSVIAKMGAKDVASFTRLYMVPGMQHCAGGPGPNSFGEPMRVALEQWVEQKKAPDAIVASHATRGNVDRTRPLCPYPQVAKYNGSGSIDDAANFTCRVP